MARLSLMGIAAGFGRAADRLRRARRRGQMVVLFVLSIFVLTGITALVVDVSWYWANSLRVQRAADAAALAGAVQLPGDPDAAISLAIAEARKNGYIDGANSTTVTPVVDADNDRRLDVTIDTRVNTFFMRIFGFQTIPITRTSKAEFTLPVPMGSPQNYYGLGYFIGKIPGDTGWDTTSSAQPTTTWTNPTRADGTVNASYAVSGSSDGSNQQWYQFGLTSGSSPLIPSGATIDGIEIRMRAVLSGSGSTTTNCKISADMNWNNGSSGSWSSTETTPALTTTTPAATYILGSDTDTSVWGGHSWSQSDFSDSNFRLRLTFNKTTCSSSRTVSVDTLEIRVSYHTVGQTNVDDPISGNPLTPQNFWGAMQSQGAPNIQGDAYMTKYQSRQGGVSSNPAYDFMDYYNYGIDMPANATSGKVYIFDPGFCDVATSKGTGEDWTTGGANGYSSNQPVSAYFDLYDTRNTPYDLTDDILVGTSGDTFERVNDSDPELGGSGGSDCSSQSWHNGWYQLPLTGTVAGGGNGTTYRLHTYSTDCGGASSGTTPACTYPNPKTSSSDQNNTTALNAFAMYVTASNLQPGVVPKIYGIGAMEAYARLPGNATSEFYLAQIASVHAGKTMLIDLWDPGDTGNLSAVLKIRMPGSGTSYSDAQFTYTASAGTTDSAVANCAAQSSGGSTVTSVTTNTGGTSVFQGCWLHISIVIPAAYTAPQSGWWKIQYAMGGSSSNFSTDLTTWQVSIRGNPVHLVLP